MKNSINIIRLTLIFVLFFVSCKKEQNNSQIKLVNPNIKLEKIIVINLNEVCVRREKGERGNIPGYKPKNVSLSPS